MGWQDDTVAAAVEPRLPVPAWQRDRQVGAPMTDEAPAVSAALKQHFQSNARSAQSFDDYISAGFQQSVTGLAARRKAPDVQVTQDTPWYGRLVSSLVGMAGDLPAMLPGYVGGAAAGGAAGSAVPVIGNAAGALMGGFAGANALPAGLRTVMMDAYTKGEVHSASDFVDRALHAAWETTKAGVVGAATGAAGKVASAALPMTAGAVAKVTAPTAAQIATMTTVGSALEGKLPEPQDFLDAAIVIGGLQAAGGVAGKLRQVYAKTGVPPQQVVADAARDPALALDLKPVEKPSGGDVVTAYHGSPHDFEKFDLSKIGTGEGAQAYGHGLYFAESAGTAKYYRDQLADLAINVGGKKVRVEDLTPGTPEHGAFADIKSALYGKLPPEQAIKDIRDYIAFNKTAPGIENDPHWQKVFADLESRIEILKDWTRQGVTANEGAIYKVEIPKSTVDRMLDWDRPVSQQPGNVLIALNRLRTEYGMGETLRSDMTGGEAHRILESEAASMHASVDKGEVAPGWKRNATQDIADLLKQYGIPGIRYLDGGSRGKGGGTRNFVLFDAEHARIVEKNGQKVIRTDDPNAPIEPLERNPAPVQIAAETPEQTAQIERGRQAAQRVLTEKTEIPAAVDSAAHGPVTLVYGEPGRGAKFKGGFGLSHIVAKHGADALDKVMETVVRGKVVREQGGPGADPRVRLTYDGHTAVLSRKRHGADETWLLTGWNERRPDGHGEGFDSSGPTPPDPTLTRAGEGAGRDKSISQDPLITEAHQRIAEHGDVQVTDETGKTQPLRDLMEEANRGVEAAKADANLFQVAASCMLGAL